MTNFTKEIADFTARVENLKRIVDPAAACIESHGWIVCYPNSTTAYAFDLVAEGKKYRATNARVEDCENVNRFTKEDARTVAASCASTVEGGAQALVARHYRDVCRDELANLQNLVAMLKKVAA